jgi:aspartate kinase
VQPSQHPPRRPIVVQKYGGSSVADVARIGKVADKVVASRNAGNDVVVVVSAMGKTTDGLLGLAREAAASGAASLAAGSTPTDPPRRELDMLLSTGERVTMSLLSIAIQARGLDAISFTGSQSGILTNDRHFDARIIEVRPHRIEDELARGRVVIVAGYQGMSYRREITTLGRGGSDTTAVALAAALSADRCEIYSDVDGVYSADPRAVPEARHLPELDHAVLQEMAECGAKVVCAQAVEWARRSGIAIYARSTFDAGDGRESVIRRFSPGEGSSARAVVAETAVVLGRLGAVGVGVGDAEKSLDALLEVASEARFALKDLAFGAAGGSFLVPLLNVPDWASARRRLLTRLPVLELTEGVASVSVVGDGLGVSVEPVARLRRVLRETSAPALQITATPLRLGAIVDAERAGDVQRALHRAFVEG